MDATKFNMPNFQIDSPRISVIMPAYNCERYIKAAIDSILGQSFRGFEFIIIDDGSTDDTRSIAEAAAARDPRIRLISHRNRGITACLNEGLMLASGEFIARMDGDDISMPDRFEKQIAFLDAHPDHGLVGGQFMLIDPDGRWLRGLERPSGHDALQAELLKGMGAIFHPTMMYRRQLVLDVGGYSEEYRHAEDVDFLLRISEVTKIANLNTRVLFYRLHFGSVGLTRRREQLLAAYRAVVAAAERRGLIPPPRPEVSDPNTTRADVYSRWGWWALQGGQLRTARLYAAKALLRRPLDLKTLRLAACALRGR